MEIVSLWPNQLTTKTAGDRIKTAIVKMKKFYLLVSLSFCTLLVLPSCSKDSKCHCNEYDADNGRLVGSGTMNASSFGAANCSDLELKLKMASGGDFYYQCSKE